MLKKFCVILLFKFFTTISSFFEGIDPNSKLNSFLILSPGNYSLTFLPEALYNDTNYLLEISKPFLDLADVCTSSYLNPSQNYSQVKPLNVLITSLDTINIQFPFSNVLENDKPFDQNKFCLVYNEKNLALNFMPIETFPCLVHNCTIILSKIFLSTENSLQISDYEPFKIYDSTSYYDVYPSKEFAMEIVLGIPSTSKNHIYYEFDTNRGFSYKSQADLLIMSSIDNLQDISLKATELELNLRLNNSKLINMGILESVNGLLYDFDSQTSLAQSCLSNGIFFSSNSSDLKFFVNMGLLSPFFGRESLELRKQVYMGLFFDIRNDENNGFFLQGSTNIFLLETKKTSLNFEIQMINNNEIKRRLSLWNNSCSTQHLSTGNTLILDLYSQINSSNSSNIWHDYFEDLNSSKFYFLMHLRTNKPFNIPLMKYNNFEIKSHLEGFILMPSPIAGELFYANFESKATFSDFDSTCEWKISDMETLWLCKIDSTIKNVDQVKFEIFTSSNWLISDQKIITLDKSFRKILIKLDRNSLARSLSKPLEEFILRLVKIWLINFESIEKNRQEAVDLIAPFCPHPPCNITDLIKKFDTSNSLYNKTKNVYKKLYDNEFNCPIYENFFEYCQNLDTVCEYLEEIFLFEPCMERVRGILIDAKKKIDLANWKEGINNLNIYLNSGLRYALEEIVLERDPFNETDITLVEKEHTFRQAITRNEIIKQSFDDYNWHIPFDNSDVDVDFDMVYSNEQSLNVSLPIKVNTTRLSKIFKGKDNITVDFEVLASFDFSNKALLEKSVQNLFSNLTKEDGLLFKAVLGENVGITDDLISIYGMNPPLIKLESPNNPVLYCNDPKIDKYYNEDNTKLLLEIRKMLGKVIVDQVYSKCASNIEYQDLANCTQHESICGATFCRFTRYVFDGCGQKSNEVFEDAVILPQKPFFKSFPTNLVLSCDENKKVESNFEKFILPEVDSGCRNVRTNLKINDLLIDHRCSESIFRNWIIEVIGCESSLFESRLQKIYIQDKYPPFFSSIPGSKTVDFFESYGSQYLGKARTYDGCGHGPSFLSNRDSAIISKTGERLISRTWTTRDTCGNKHSEIQQIKIRNSFKNDLNSNFRYFVMLALNETRITNSFIYGPVGSRNSISLVNSSIGNDLDLEEKCIRRQKWTVLSGEKISIEDSVVLGPIKSLSDFDFEKSYSQIISLSKFLNDSIRNINEGVNEQNCLETVPNLSQEFALNNFLDATCTIKKSSFLPIHSIDETNYDMNKIKRIELKANELIYNVFFFRDTKIFENKEIVLNVPSESIVIINFQNKYKTYLNRHKIRFDLSNNLTSNKVIYNFLEDGDIVFEPNEEFKEINGTILAPYSNFISISNGLSQFVNGQIFAKNIYIDGMQQNCIVSEPFLDISDF